MPKNSDLEYEKERERRRRAREERRRAEEKRARMIRLALVCVFAAALAVILFFAGRAGRKIRKTQTAENTSVPADVTEGDLLAASAAAAVEETDYSGIFVDYNAPLPKSVSTKAEALAYAEAYAAQYDYDMAVSLLRSVGSPETDQELADAISRYTAEKAACVAVDVTTIPHVFFHSLLNDDRGFKSDVVGSDRAWRNDAAMTSADEFDHMIEDMYEAGYVLVSLYDMCIRTKNENGSISIAKNTNLMLPEGKKAFVLSEDDLSYYHTYGIGTQGYATKMVIDENGKVKCEYTNENGETLIGDYDVAPRLNTFIQNHPDFAYHNARGTIALTGYNGVFGYRTNDYYKDIDNPKLDADQIEWLRDHPDFDWDEDVANATAIADELKREGWTFASHTYGHWNASTKSVDALKSDNERWMTVNHNIVGDIDIIIFAFGGDIGVVNSYTSENEKFQYFKSQGYCIYCNVDGNIGWTEFGPDYMRTGRVALDGFTMYQAMTEDGASHGTYARDYEILGIKDVESFFNPYRITPIESE